jgi:hypothetical protein
MPLLPSYVYISVYSANTKESMCRDNGMCDVRSSVYLNQATQLCDENTSTDEWSAQGRKSALSQQSSPCERNNLAGQRNVRRFVTPWATCLCWSDATFIYSETKIG